MTKVRKEPSVQRVRAHRNYLYREFIQGAGPSWVIVPPNWILVSVQP